MADLLERMGHGDITGHDFGFTFRDWVEETTSFACAVAEAALGHIVGDKMEAVYRRGDLLESMHAEGVMGDVLHRHFPLRAGFAGCANGLGLISCPVPRNGVAIVLESRSRGFGQWTESLTWLVPINPTE